MVATERREGNSMQPPPERARRDLTLTRLPIAESPLALSSARQMPLLHRSDGSAHHFAGGADHALGLELGNRLAVLLPAPIEVATPVYGSRWPEELVQTIVEQRIIAVVLFDHLTGRRHPSQAGSALTVVLAGWHGFSRWQSLGCRMGRPKSFQMS